MNRVGAKCAKCSHVWIVCYLPMMMTLACKIIASMSAHCPKCGATGALTAKDDELPGGHG